MSDRYFCSTPISQSAATLRGDEARHLAGVMRAKTGERVILFDGSGVEFVAEVASLRKDCVELQVLERRELSRELPLAVTVAVALPKGERQKWLVEKLTELGVATLIPLITDRGVAQPVESALERLRRTVIEASKQCGRNRLLEIAEPQFAAHFFRTTAEPALRLIAAPDGCVAGRFNGGRQAIVAAVGPEGGFTPEESTIAAEAGWQAVALGPAILRVETAAIALAAWAATTGYLVDPELPPPTDSA